MSLSRIIFNDALNSHIHIHYTIVQAKKKSMNLYPTVIRNTIQVIATVNFSHDNNNFEENEEKNTIDFAAILTGRELQEQDILDTALAIFQSTSNRDDKNNNLKYSVKVTDTDKIKEIHIHTVKPKKKR